MQLIDRIHATAEADPSRVAYRDARTGRTLTYAALSTDIDRHRSTPLAGRPVVLVARNDLETPARILGLLAAGVDLLLAIPTSTRYELAALVGRISAAAIVDGDAPLAPATSARSAQPGTLLLTTSGTTGEPRIVRRSASSIDAVAAGMVEAVGHTASDDVLATVPLAHSYGIEHGLLAPLWAGATTTLANGLDLAAITSAFAGGRITLFPTVPALLERLVESSGAIASLGNVRRIYSAGGRLPEKVRDGCLQRFGVMPGQVFGSTEIGSVTFLADGRGRAPGNVGVPMRGVSIRIAEDSGEVAIRAPSMFDRYHDGEAASLVDGHFLTGDLGRIEPDGSLTLTGRSKLLIDTGGPKVDPLEVERVLESHPAIACCCVVAIRQSDAVSRLRAIIVARSGVARPTAESVRAFAMSRLAPHKVPRVVEFRDALPRTALGKIARQQLEES